MSRNLAGVRAELEQRRARAALVADRFAAFVARAGDDDQIPVVELRCGERCRNLLAKVYLVDEGALFVSRIKWLPSDQINLRPWERDRYLAETRLAELDDDQLAQWLDYLDEWTLGLPVDGPRWLAAGVDTGLRDVLTEPAGPGRWLPALWTRCKRHPEQVEAADRGALLTTTRAAMSDLRG